VVLGDPGFGQLEPLSVGTPLSHRDVVRAFKELLRPAGLPGTTRLYDLQHTCATLMLSRDVHSKSSKADGDIVS
jgi:hypothetical protein